jgi:hypothetical protein
MSLTFGVVALITLASVAIFMRLKGDAGSEVSGQRSVTRVSAEAPAE